MSWIRRNPDRLVLAFLFLTILYVGISRLDYAGDGLRHLDHILDSNHPALGEPRWVLFPALLFAVIKPFQALGVIHSTEHSTEEAAKIFCLFNVFCGFVYLMCLWRWLLDLSAVRRAAVLLPAAGSYVFLSLATDTIEPTAAITVAVLGITIARFHRGWSDMARLTLTVEALAGASLIYQGLLFGFFLLPALFPVSLLRRVRALIGVASAVLAVPVITIILLTAGGDSPRDAARRFMQGEANSESASQYSKVSAKDIAGVMIVGPAYAFANIADLRGVSGSIKLLRNRQTVAEGIRGAAAWGCMTVAIIGAIFLLIRRKEFALLLAFAGMLLLPAIRMSQYGYMKYYVLLPFLVVLTVPRLRVPFVYPGLLGALLLLSNLDQINAQRMESEDLRLQVARDLYPKAPSGTCFLASGWGPPVPEWRGKSLAWLHILNSGNSRSMEENGRANSEALRQGLRELFCTCPAVLTDNFIPPNQESLQQDLSRFRIRGIPLSILLVRSPDQAKIFQSRDFTVYRFPEDDRQRACSGLK